jgi:hypothetical protein
VVVGVKLNYKQRDDVHREVSAKLSQIQPPVPPVQFRLEIHTVLDSKSQEIDDIQVAELSAPRGNYEDLYATGGREVWVKTNGGKRNLNGLLITKFCGGKPHAHR